MQQPEQDGVPRHAMRGHTWQADVGTMGDEFSGAGCVHVEQQDPRRKEKTRPRTAEAHVRSPHKGDAGARRRHSDPREEPRGRAANAESVCGQALLRRQRWSNPETSHAGGHGGLPAAGRAARSGRVREERERCWRTARARAGSTGHRQSTVRPPWVREASRHLGVCGAAFV